jgi:hypothetical protein
VELDIPECAEVDLDVRQGRTRSMLCELLLRCQIEFPVVKIDRLGIIGLERRAGTPRLGQARSNKQQGEPAYSQIHLFVI